MFRIRRADRFAAMLSVSISLAAVAPAQDNYWHGGASFWDLPANWSLGLPLAEQNLYIGYSPYTFSGGTFFRTGTTSVGSLFSKNALTISGGLLNLNSTTENSTISAALNVAGGKLGGGANLVVGGLTTLTGGTVGGSGKLIANGGVTISSGTVRIADTRTMENRGAMTWSGGSVGVDSGATVSNASGSTFVANAAAQWTGGFLVNAGNLTHSVNTTRFSEIALSNTGSIESSGGELRFVAPTAFYNSGTIKATGNGRITFQGGTYDVTGSGLSTAANGTITISGATLTGGAYAPWTIPSTAVTGSIRLSDSTLGVTLVKNSDRLGFYGSNTLDGVAGDRGFRFLNGGVQNVVNGFTPGGTVALDYGARLAYLGDRSIDYTIDVQENGTNPSSGILMSAGSKLTLAASGGWMGYGGRIDAGGSAFDFRNDATMDAISVLVVDVDGGTLTNTGTITGHAQNSDYGGGSVLAIGSGSFVNSGTIRGDGGGVNLTGTSGAAFSNSGKIEAINGGSAGIFKNSDASTVNWTNAGEIQADGEGSRLFLGGSFTMADLGNFSVTNGASAAVYGVFDNTDHTLKVSSPNAWILSTGGKIKGGVIIGSSNLGFENIYRSTTLQDVALDGGLNMTDGQVTLSGKTLLNGKTTMSGVGTRLNFAESTTLRHDLNGYGKIGMTADGGVLTIASDAKLEGMFNINGYYPKVDSFTLINEGVFRGLDSGWLEGRVVNSGLYEQAAGRQVVYADGGIENSGTFRAVDTGNIYIGGDGRLTNSGTLAALRGAYLNLDMYASGQTLTNSGTLRIDSDSNVALRNGFGQTSTGLLSIGIGSTGNALFAIGGDVSLMGDLGVSFDPDFIPTVGSLYTFMTYSGNLSGRFNPLDSRWSVIYGAGTVSVQVNAVPEPTPFVVLGVGTIAFLRRRRKS